LSTKKHAGCPLRVFLVCRAWHESKRRKSAAEVLIANRIVNPKVHAVRYELKEGASEILT